MTLYEELDIIVTKAIVSEMPTPEITGALLTLLARYTVCLAASQEQDTSTTLEIILQEFTEAVATYAAHYPNPDRPNC